LIAPASAPPNSVEPKSDKTNLTESRTNGALHLAAAVRLGCDYFVAQDRGFPLGHEIEGMKLVRPQVIWQEDLFEAAGA
jgi:hypothetical protein